MPKIIKVQLNAAAIDGVKTALGLDAKADFNQVLLDQKLITALPQRGDKFIFEIGNDVREDESEGLEKIMDNINTAVFDFRKATNFGLDKQCLTGHPRWSTKDSEVRGQFIVFPEIIQEVGQPTQQINKIVWVPVFETADSIYGAAEVKGNSFYGYHIYDILGTPALLETIREHITTPNAGELKNALKVREVGEIDLTAPDENGFNILTQAVATGNAGLVKTILKYTPSEQVKLLLSTVDRNGTTALHEAADDANEIIKMLIDYGMDANVIDSNDKGSYDIASEDKKKVISKYFLEKTLHDKAFGSFTTLLTLLETIREHITTPNTGELKNALEGGEVEEIDLTAPEENGFNILTQAVATGDAGLVRTILKYTPSEQVKLLLSTVDRNCTKALYKAVDDANEIIKMLIDYGMAANVRDSNNKGSYDIASEDKQKVISKYFLEKTALDLAKDEAKKYLQQQKKAQVPNLGSGVDNRGNVPPKQQKTSGLGGKSGAPSSKRNASEMGNGEVARVIGKKETYFKKPEVNSKVQQKAKSQTSEIVLIDTSAGRSPNPRFRAVSTNAEISRKITTAADPQGEAVSKFNDIVFDAINTAIDNSGVNGGQKLHPTLAGIVMLITIKNGGIGNSQESMRQDLEKLQQKGILPSELNLNQTVQQAVNFSREFQNEIEKQGIFTGNENAADFVGLRLKRLDPSFAGVVIVDAQSDKKDLYNDLMKVLEIDKIVQATSDTPQSAAGRRSSPTVSKSPKRHHRPLSSFGGGAGRNKSTEEQPDGWDMESLYSEYSR